LPTTPQCWPNDCVVSQGIDMAIWDFDFDFSSCISPTPLSDCQIVSPKNGGTVGISTLGCKKSDGTLEIVITDPTAFEIVPDCLPSGYYIDLDCVSDQIVAQYTQEVIDFYIDLFGNPEDDFLVTKYYKQLCVSYCTVWLPWPRVEMVQCGDSYSCCVTETKWVITESGYDPQEITTKISGDCSDGPAPSCPRGGIFSKGDPFNLPSPATSCIPRYCFLQS